MAATGDCYRANGRFAISHMEDDRWELCHGVGILKTDGEPFGHAWVELGPVVFDHSNGNKIQMAKKLYYKIGGIPVKGWKIIRYTGEEAGIKMLKNQHWGPWDYNPPR